MLYSQWLANVLQIMGVPRSEFEMWGHQGYGIPYMGDDNGYKAHYGNSVATSRYHSDASNILLMLKA